MNQFELIIPRSGALKVRESAGLPPSSSPVEVIPDVHCGVWRKRGKISSERMGGDPITTEPSVLKVDEEVRGILEGAGLLSFFRKFMGFNEEISHQVVESWSDGKGQVITREKTNQVGQLTKFIKDDETFCWLDSGIAMENKEKVNIPLFLLKYLEKSVNSIKAGKGKAPLHQGLMKLLFDYEKEKRSAAAGPTRRGFSRLSWTPVSKAWLLLGPTPISPAPKFGEAVSDSEEDSCKRRSTRLQKKSTEKAKIVDFVDPSEEDHTVSEVDKNMKGGCSFKMAGFEPLEKGPVKGPDGTQTLIEKLRCHLKLLNGLGSSLSNTCACINLLTLEITNYLKEVVKTLKDLSAAKEQQKPTGKEEEN
eukprot:Gb_18254 [translate_table: standard]